MNKISKNSVSLAEKFVKLYNFLVNSRTAGKRFGIILPLVIVSVVVIFTSFRFWEAIKSRDKEIGRLEEILNKQNPSAFSAGTIDDLDGDGNPERLIVGGPFGSGGFIDYIVFTEKEGELKEIWKERRIFQGRVRFIDGQLEVKAGYLEDNEYICCPDKDSVSIYDLINGKMSLVKEEVVENKINP